MIILTLIIGVLTVSLILVSIKIYLSININSRGINNIYSNKIIGKSLERILPSSLKNIDQDYLLAITSKECEVCHIYFNKAKEISEINNIPILELSYGNNKENSLPYDLVASNRLLNKLDIKQFPTYIYITKDQVAKNIFLTERELELNLPTIKNKVI